MDKRLDDALKHGAAALEITLLPGAGQTLQVWVAELLKWNAKVNLTAITDPLEVVEKHLLDSLAVLPELVGAATLLDLGAGAGLPGLPLAVALPALKVTLADAANKKVAFLKHVIIQMNLAGRVRAVHARAAGLPAKEGLPVAQVVIARALMEVGQWVPFALPYLEANGRLVAMMARPPTSAALTQLAAAHALRLRSLRSFTLPFSKDPRSVAVFERST